MARTMARTVAAAAEPDILDAEIAPAGGRAANQSKR